MWLMCKVASVQRSSRAKLFLCKVIPVQSGSCARWFLCKVVLLHKRCCSKSLLVLCHKCPIVKRFMGEDDCANTHLRHFCKKLSLHRGKSGSCGKWFLCVKDAVQRVSWYCVTNVPLRRGLWGKDDPVDPLKCH